MATDINGIRPTPSTSADQASALRTNGREQKAPAAPTPAPAQGNRAVSDSVSLSQSAQTLKSLEGRMQKLPEVDEKRVAQIKAALASGQYKVDDLVVADKLLGMDSLFE